MGTEGEDDGNEHCLLSPVQKADNSILENLKQQICLPPESVLRKSRVICDKTTTKDNNKTELITSDFFIHLLPV